VASRGEVILSEMDFDLDDGEFVAEVSEAVVLVAVAFQFGGGIPVVEVGNGTMKCVEGGGWTDKESVEPYGKGLGDVQG
jgi:hypothetical protein